MTKSLKQRVAYILERYPVTRNSDTKLILTLYEHFYYLSQTLSVQKLHEVMDYDSPDDIVRFRRHIQNKEKKLLPTDPVILEKRRIKIDQARVALGYPPLEGDSFNGGSQYPQTRTCEKHGLKICYLCH